MTFAGALIPMLNIDVTLALVTVLIVPAMAALTTIFGGRTTRTWRAIFSRLGAGGCDRAEGARRRCTRSG